MADNQVLIQIRGDVADINAKLADLKGHIGTVRAEADKLAGNAKLSFAILATGVNQAISVIQQIYGQVRQFTDAYAEAETATMKLAVAMRNQGDYSREALAELEAYAAQIQKTTAYEDDYVKARMATLKTYGMTNDEVKNAMASVLDLAAARKQEGMTAEQAADLIGKAYIGQTDRLKRYGIVIDENIPKGERFNEVLKQVQGRFGGAASAELDTYVGQVQQLKNQMGDIAEIIGMRLIQALRALQVALDVVAAGFWSMVEQILSGLTWLINRLEDFARWAEMDKIADGLATAGDKVRAGAVYASGKFQENIGLVVKHFDQMRKIGDIDAAIQKLKPGQRFRPPGDEDKAAEKAAADAHRLSVDLWIRDEARKWELLEQQQKDYIAGLKVAQAAREADIHNRLAALDLAEAEGAYHRDTLLERQKLLRELLALQQNWLDSIDAQDRTAINVQTAALLKTQQQIAGVGIEMRPVFTELKKYAEDATDAWTQVGSAVANVFKGMEDALVEFVKTGKLNFSDFAQSVILDLIRIQIRASITGPMAEGAGSFFGDIFKLLGGNFEYHSGGMGSEPTKYRIMPNPDMLPRYHKGLGPGERMSVTTDDEMILTPGQQKRMAELMSGKSGGASSGPQSVRVEIVNQGQPVKATKAEGNFNGQEYVVTVFLDALNRNAYGLRNALAGG